MPAKIHPRLKTPLRLITFTSGSNPGPAKDAAPAQKPDPAPKGALRPKTLQRLKTRTTASPAHRGDLDCRTMESMLGPEHSFVRYENPAPITRCCIVVPGLGELPLDLISVGMPGVPTRQEFLWSTCPAVLGSILQVTFKSHTYLAGVSGVAGRCQIPRSSSPQYVTARNFTPGTSR